MKTNHPLLPLLLFPALAAAQLDMRMEAENLTVLQFENIPCRLTIHNTSQDAISLGGAEGATNSIRLVLRYEGNPIRGHGGPNPDAAQIKRGKPCECVFDLSQYCDIRRVGRYTVWAKTTWSGTEFASNPLVLDVVRGVELKSINGSVAGYPENVRAYSLRYWHRKNREILFLVVESEKEGVNYGVFNLGELLRVSEPEIEFDAKGHLKVVHQCAGECYAHSVFESNRDGVHFLGQQLRDRSGKPYKFVRQQPSSEKKDQPAPPEP